MNIRYPRTVLASAALTTAGLLLAGCGTATSHTTMPGMSSTGASIPSHDVSPMNPTDPMSGMPMAHGNGLNQSQDGYTLQLKSGLMSSMPMPVTFLITKGGQPVTDFQTEQTKKLHFYLIRNDLSGFRHLHPTMSANGTWSVTVPAVDPGEYRIYTQILLLGASEPTVLSTAVTVPGAVNTVPLPAASGSVTVDGYTVTLDGKLSNGRRLGVSFTKAGKPVTDLQPYLDTYAHITAFHTGDLAFTHLHPTNKVTLIGGGPDLNFMVEVPEPGTYRLFIQFMTGNTLHTAAITTTAS